MWRRGLQRRHDARTADSAKTHKRRGCHKACSVLRGIFGEPFMSFVLLGRHTRLDMICLEREPFMSFVQEARMPRLIQKKMKLEVKEGK